MAKLSDVSPKIQMLGAAGLVLGLTLVGYFTVPGYKGMADANTASAASLKAKHDENERLKQYEPKLADMNRQIDTLKGQLEDMKRIVPDEKLADQFIHLMQDVASNAGIEIRRYTARQVNTKEFYTEAPYEMELDGPYYSMLKFFDKLGSQERIINVGGLKVANLKNGSSVGARKAYAYAATESVVATCTTTTFFSRDNFTKPGAPVAAPPAAK